MWHSKHTPQHSECPIRQHFKLKFQSPFLNRLKINHLSATFGVNAPFRETKNVQSP
jgi:hypothetical protein